MLYFRAFLCVLIVLVLGASFFIRRYKRTKLYTYRLICWWGRIASGLLMVAGGMLLVIMMGEFIDTLIKAFIVSSRFGMDAKDILSEIYEDNGFLEFLLMIAIEVLASYFGYKGVVNYNEMFLSEYREADKEGFV